MVDVREKIMQALWADQVPNRVRSLLNAPITTTELVDFSLNPVLNSNPENPTRLAVARTTEQSEWIAHVHSVFNSEAAVQFWASAPLNTRQMIDTDGSRHFVVYNDDLQPPPHPLLAIALSTRSGVDVISRTAQLPQPLPASISAMINTFRRPERQGQWAIRTHTDHITGVLWVSESRWLGNAPQSTACVFELPQATGWRKRWRALEEAGFTLYPDTLEFRIDGTIDLTVGFLPRESHV